MESKKDYLVKNILLLMVSGVVPKIISFIIIPVITAYLSSGDYGAFEMVQTTVQLFIPFFTLDIQDAVMRFSFDASHKKEDVFSSGFYIILFGTFLVSIITFFVSISRLININNTYFIFFVLIYFFNAINNSFTRFLRGLDKVNVIVWSSVLDSIVMLFANILFVVKLKMGVFGFLMANTLGIATMSFVCFFCARLYKYFTIKISKKTIQEMILYSMPLIAGAVSWWVNTASDRYIVTLILGIEINGLYAIAYKIPNLLTMAQNIFSQAWSISAIKEYDKDDKDGFIRSVYSTLFSFLIVSCSLLMILRIPIARILYSKEFFVAWRFVPPLLVSVVFNAMALFYGNLFAVVKDTKSVAFSTVVGAIVNIIFNFLFILITKDAYGAAVATLLSNCIIFLLRKIKFKKYISFSLDDMKKTMMIILIIAQMLLSIYKSKYIIIEAIIFAIIIILSRAQIVLLFYSFKNKVLNANNNSFNNEYDYLTHLLKCALHNEKPMEKPERLSFDKVYEYSKEHMVENMAYISIQKLDNKPCEELLKRWERDYFTCIYIEAMQDEFRDNLLKVFAKFGIKSTEIQGTAIKNLYPSSDLRRMSDLDFVVCEKDFPKICEILKKVGFACEIDNGYNNNPVEIWADRPDGMVLEFHVDYFHEKGNHFDIHNPFINATVTDDGFSYKAAPENIYLYTMLHFLRHLDGGCGLRRLMDLYLIRHKMYDGIDKDYINNFIEKNYYKKQLDEFFEISESLFGKKNEIVSDKYRDTINRIYKAGAHGKPLLPFEQFAKKEKFLAIAKIKYFFCLTFPPKQKLYNRYVILRKYSISLPLCWIYKAYKGIIRTTTEKLKSYGGNN